MIEDLVSTLLVMVQLPLRTGDTTALKLFVLIVRSWTYDFFLPKSPRLGFSFIVLLVAASNTSLIPWLVFAEHSRYFRAPIVLRTSSAYCSHIRQKFVKPRLIKVLHTSSGVTGCWEYLASSSTSLGSWRKSFLQPTSIIGTPGQKCDTSEIHFGASEPSLPKVSCKLNGLHAPFLVHCRASLDYWWQSISGKHACRGRKVGVVDHSHPFLQCPTKRARLDTHQPQYQQHSFRRRWARWPSCKLTLPRPEDVNRSNKKVCATSGKVSLENTLQTVSWLSNNESDWIREH